MKKANNHPHICIAHPGSGGYSETFIRDHISKIPRVETVLSKGFFPALVNDKPTLSTSFKFLLKAARTFRKESIQQWIDQQRNSKLASILHRQKVDIVLAEYGPTGCTIAPACASAGIPLIVHFHGQDTFHRPTLEKYKTAYDKMFQSAAGYIIGTEQMRTQLEKLGAPAEKIYKNPCGADTKLFQPINPATNPPTFVTLGRFVEKKAPQLTLLAFNRVVQKHPEARLVMIGSGVLLEACQQMAKALKIEDKVTFTGAIEQHRIPPIMKKARAFVQHSATPESGDSEGTSISVLEACATGLPVISTYHGGIKDSIIHNTTGFLSEEYDIDSMAEHMLRLTENPELAAQMGKNGRKRMEEVYTMEQSIGNLHQIIQTVFEKHRG